MKKPFHFQNLFVSRYPKQTLSELSRLQTYTSTENALTASIWMGDRQFCRWNSL